MKVILRILFSFFLLSVSSALFAQSHKTVRNFKGRVVDSATLLPMKDVSVCLYRSRDTSLINFAFTTPNGNFTISTSNKDSVILIFSIMGYNDKGIREPATEREWNMQNYGDIKLSTMPYQLTAFTIKSAAIRMKGDTMEINASRFKVLPGSDVAQLFKKIPGFEVNVKGEIKVAGASVEKILVDGSDFFGNNPGLVSKNLTADMIETVQVFEEKNEDGSPKTEQTKVINLKLKKGKRNGTFGDVLGGIGNNDLRYESGLRLNNFKNDRKFSFIFNSNNINSTGFDFGFNNWHNAQNEERNGTTNSGNFYTQYSNNDNEGNINDRLETGLTYFNEFSKKRKFSVDLNFQRNKYSSISASNAGSPINDSTRRFNIDSNVINGLSYSASANIDYTKVIDSTGNFDIGIRSSFDMNDFATNKDNIILFNTSEINRGLNDLKNIMTNSYLRITATYGRFLRKNKRYRYSISGNFRNYQDDNDIWQYLSNTTDTFNNLTSQNISRQEYLLKAFGQMPLYKFWSLNLSADRWQQDNAVGQRTDGVAAFKQNNFKGEYNMAIDSLTLNYKNNIEQYTVKPYISYNKRSLYVQFGVTYMRYILENSNEKTNVNLRKPYDKGLPFFYAGYYSKTVGYFSLSVNKGVSFPSSADLLPVLNLTNTYQRKIGNPLLDPVETYSFRSYNNFNKVKGFKSLYVMVSGSLSDNAKIYVQEINGEGIVNQKPINATGKKDMNISGGFNKRLNKKFNWNNYASYSSAISPAFINQVKTVNRSNNVYYYPSFSYEPSDSLETSIGLSINSQDFKNDLNSKLDYKQLILGYNFKLRAVFKYGTEVNTSLNLDDQRNVPGIGKLVTIWNLYLQQSIGKKGKFHVKLSAYDILKQNTSISRSVSDNYIYISQNNQLTQYFMMTLIYKIKSVGKSDDEEFAY